MAEPDVMIQASSVGMTAIGGMIGSIITALGMYYYGGKGKSASNTTTTTTVTKQEDHHRVKPEYCEKVQAKWDDHLASIQKSNDEEHRLFAREIGGLKEYRAAAAAGMSALVEKVDTLRADQASRFGEISRQISDYATMKRGAHTNERQ